MSYYHALDRLTNLGLPNEVVKPILLTVSSWIKASGPEWTVTRLKELKTWYIHKLSGKQYNPNVWIAEKDGNPKGCFKPIFRMKPGAKTFNALMIYTGFTLNRVSVKQKEKFFTSLASENISLPNLPRLKDVVREYSQYLPPRIESSLEEYPFSDKKRAPVGKYKTGPEGPHLIWEDVKSRAVCDILEDIDISGDIGRSWLRIMMSKAYDSDADDDTVGRISVVQEPGCKARFLANPKRIFQVALRPLGRQLLGLLKQLPWDCTHRQMDGVTWVQAQLNAGKTVHSVDLSDATNNFPLDLQMRVLGWLEGLDEQDIALFRRVSRGNWYVPPDLRLVTSMETTKWSKGQPLGLYPSFMAFAFTHGCLVKSIEVLTKRYDTFRVLGDDIVISDDEVASIYRNYLEDLRIPISQSKTIVSDQVAEFAGVLITPRTAYIGSKWRTPGKTNKIPLLASLPRRLQLGKQEEFTAYLLKSAPKPFGLGLNPEGLSLSTRCQLFLPWYLKSMEDTCVLERTSYNSWLYKVPEPEPNVVPISRDGVQDFTQSITCRWDEQHPWTPFVREVHGTSDQEVPELWKRLVQYFKFQSIDPPPELRGVTVKWLMSSGMGYLRQAVDNSISIPSSSIGRILYSIQYKHQVNYMKMGPRAKENYLRDVSELYLNSLVEP